MAAFFFSVLYSFAISYLAQYVHLGEPWHHETWDTMNNCEQKIIQCETLLWDILGYVSGI